jgi:hypothetical protein
MSKKNCRILSKFKGQLYSAKLKETYRYFSKDFIGNRKLPFTSVVLFMISLVKKEFANRITFFYENPS